MRRYGTERASSETSPVDVYRELDHLESRYHFPFVFGMRQAGIGKVVGSIYLRFRHWREGRIHYDHLFSYLLQDT